MEFGLDEGQLELQQTVARFCVDRFPLDTIVEREGLPTDQGRWSEMAELGILGLFADGDPSAGVGVLESALVFEQLGSHLVPGPVMWTVLAAPFVEGAASGERRVGGVMDVDVVDGSAIVEHGAEIDVVLVARSDGLFAHRVDELPPAEPLDPLDPLTPVSRHHGLDGGSCVADREATERLLMVGTVLTAAQLVGVAWRSLEVARAYAVDRHQFGVPIGSFQAVKHLLADMHVRSGLAQSAAYAAAAMVQDPGNDDPLRAAGAAKLLAGDAAVANAGTAIQVLGGMGFTWEMLPNHLLKRAWVLEQSFGTADDHALRLGAALVEAAS
jgi:alkylation response protein AidB-like acyl-CoA dehydrogenase